MFYAHIDNKNNIIDFSEVEYLNFINIEVSQEQYNLAQEKGKDYFIYSDGEIILNPDYEKEEADKRKQVFLQDFFKIEGYGYYRRQPKGYQSAVESMGVLFNTALAMNEVPENIIIFYQEPDFTKPEECTEEWLVKHQIIMPALTKEQFFALWSAFTIAWNTEEHE